MTQTMRPPWLGIELRHLASLSAVAQERSFRGAADSLGYVQSAVSQQLAHLERIVGIRLVDRRRGTAPVSLTEAGELLLHHTDEILSRFRAAEADMNALREGRCGRLRVGVYEPIASRVMPHALVTFARRIPGIEVQMDDVHSAGDLAGRVEKGELDVAFGEVPLPTGPFEAREVLRDPYVLLVPADWSIAQDEGAVSTEVLGSIPLVGTCDAGSSARLDTELRVHGVEPRYVFRSGIQSAAQALVAAGIGAAILPRLCVDTSDERTVAIDLSDLIPPRSTALYWHRERRSAPGLDAFAEVAAVASLEATTSGRSYTLAA
jgi:DNA-binding transcriptional LysR family regulator